MVDDDTGTDQREPTQQRVDQPHPGSAPPKEDALARLRERFGIGR